MKHYTVVLVLTILFALAGFGQTTAQPLSDTDIEGMVRAGLPPDVIVAKIRADRCNFDTSVSALEDLQNAGVPQNVILAMVQCANGHGIDHSLPRSPSFSQTEEEVLLQDGTPINLRLDETISSASVHIHDNVAFDVADPVTVNGVVVIPAGARALGSVTAVQPKRRFGRSGKLCISIDWVRDIDGDKVPLRATKDGTGGGNLALMTGAMVATGAVFLPAAPLFLFMHGKDSILQQGTVLTAFVSRDVIVGRLTHQ